MNFTDHDELDRRMKRRRRRQQSDVFWNFMTVLTLLASISLIGVLLMIYSNPFISINPFPPPTMPVLVILPTSTATPVVLPPTWTPTVAPTETPAPATSTPEILPTETTTYPTAAANSLYTFGLQAAPSAVKSDTFKPATGCAWQGVAGQVLDLQGRHLVNIGIVLKGTYNGKTISTQSISGTHTEYGDSGYEFPLSTTPISSTGLLSIQLVDQAGLPLSEQVIFDTFDTCDKNLVLVNFRQVK
ncbi:MAG: hypothetical protein CVU42_17770 [Chloroflexi bacterium HGW-Chloroflexi-4]|jgi:hypothetical protein|nr:MAG: hypothetical protein CVU42_17770 [Chloroflexi bacterium HGW-Chloroflexi-4]